MGIIKIEAEIEIDDEFWYSHNDEEELEWFKSMLDDRENTMLILWSNDVGDEIGQTNEFKWRMVAGDAQISRVVSTMQ
jgi:hypothetical protein